MKKHMIYSRIRCAWAGDHVTSDISKGLQMPLAVAEKIKTRHGGLYATGMDDREMIEIGGDSGDWEKDRRQVSRTELIGIMRPRVEEILEEVRARLDAAGLRQPAKPADRADRRREPDPGAGRAGDAGAWASACGLGGRSGCRVCRRQRPGRPSLPAR